MDNLSAVELMSECECFQLLRKHRWRNGVFCPICHSTKVVKNGRDKFEQNYLCRECKRGFSDRTGTVFQNSNIPLSQWFYILKRLTEKAKVSDVSKELGRAYRNVFYEYQKLSKSLRIGRETYLLRLILDIK